MLTHQLLLAGALISAVQGIYLNSTSTTASSTSSAVPSASGLPSTKDFSFPSNTIADGVASFGFKLDLHDYPFSYAYTNTTDSPIDLVPNSAALAFYSKAGNSTAGSSSGTFTTGGFFLTLGGAPSTPYASLGFYYKGSTSDASATQTFDFWLPVITNKRAVATYVKYTVTVTADANGGSGSVVATTVTVDLFASSSSTASTTATTTATDSSTATDSTIATDSSTTTTGSSGSTNGVVVSTSSVTSETTTLVTITSCSDDKCSTTTSEALVSIATATVEGTITEYTTYCPLSTDKHWSTSSTWEATSTVTGSGWTSTEGVSVETEVAASSGWTSTKGVSVETEVAASSGWTATTAEVSTYEAGAGKKLIAPLALAAPLLFVL